MPNPRIKVLVVDDSALMRKFVSDILGADSEIEVIGTCRDGVDCLAKVDALNPDVITLDVEMPRMDGLETLERLMAIKRRPVVMISSLTQAGAETTIKSLQLGAFDFVAKPSGAISLDLHKVGAEIVDKVRAAAGAKVSHAARAAVAPVQATPTPAASNGKVDRVLLIGSSTGGPKALNDVVPHLPRSLNLAIVIVQHLPESFTSILASRLNADSEFDVKEAQEGDELAPGLALIAPGGKHLQFKPGGVATLTSEPPLHGVRPAIDVTMTSLVPMYGPRMIGAILTGMGRDGALGLKALREVGGRTLAEDESTCVIFGMPKAAQEIGAVEKMVPIHLMAQAIAQAVGEAPLRRAS